MKRMDRKESRLTQKMKEKHEETWECTVLRGAINTE